MPRREKGSYSIQSVENALDLLEIMCKLEGNVRISQLSEQLGMNKTSIFRLLATFENRGYVEKELNSGKYRLGLSAYEMGQKLLSHMVLLRKAKPAIEKLARSCNEAIYLAVPQNNEILLLDMVDTTQQVKIVPLLGNRYPISGPSAGRIILAHSNSHLKSCSTSSLSGLETELPSIHKQGYSCDFGQFGEGIASAAVPLFEEQGNVVGSLCLIGPEFRLSQDKLRREILPPLIDAGVVISSKLGYVSHFIENNR